MPDGKYDDNKDITVCRWHSGVIVEIESMKIALNLARGELDRRLEGMNEFREQLRNQAQTFVTREYSEVRNQNIEDRVRSLENKKSNLEGRMWILPTIIVIIQIVLTVFTIVTRN